MNISFKNSINILIFVSLVSRLASATPEAADVATDRSFSNKGTCCKKVICADLVKTKKVWTERLDVEKGCKACRTITEEDFLEYGKVSKTFVINEPGKYCLGESIHFDSQEPDAFAILIDADDVKLDLCCNKLQQVNDTIGVVGIELVPGHQNIKIQNGTICNFQGAAVHAFIPETVPQVNLDTLCFTDLTLIDNGDGTPDSGVKGGTGLSLDSFRFFPNELPATFSYFNVLINNCKINGNSIIGCNLNSINNLTIIDCQINDTFADIAPFFGLIVGLLVQSSRNVDLVNCSINNTVSNDANGFPLTVLNASGFSVENAQISHCQFNNVRTDSGVLSSNYLGAQNVNFLWQNCQFNGCFGGLGVLLPQAFHVSDVAPSSGSFGSKFSNCQFNDVVGLSETSEEPVLGLLYLTVDDLILDNCQASNIYSPTLPVYGFHLDTTSPDGADLDRTSMQSITVRDCVVSDLTADARRCYGIFYGPTIPRTAAFDTPVNPELANVVHENCIIERLRSSSETEDVAGIAAIINDTTPDVLPMLINNFFVRDCRISDIKRTVDGATDNVAGIYLKTVVRPVICNNSISDAGNGIVFTGSNAINPSNFFQLAATPADAQNLNFIELTAPLPATLPLQTFKNLAQVNQVDIDPQAEVKLAADAITPTENLNGLGWELGDPVLYESNGGDNITDLVSSTTYYAIVYVPGFTRDGLVQQNKVDNCPVAGYRDTREPTASAWVDNTAFNNGTPASAAANYAINFAGAPPVTAGTLAAYPTGDEKAFNISLIP